MAATTAASAATAWARRGTWHGVLWPKDNGGGKDDMGGGGSSSALASGERHVTPGRVDLAA